ncbi:hypothetical protein B0H13DRAFT_1880645 [Mycena leptocephala]|nr:hypothetical protein B0H13DRAFT_1880645 [Mycena leptocephala]
MSRTTGDRTGSAGRGGLPGCIPSTRAKMDGDASRKKESADVWEKGVNRTSLDTRSSNGSAANAQSVERLTEVPGVLAPSRGLGVRDADVVRLLLVRADPADTASGGADPEGNLNGTRSCVDFLKNERHCAGLERES